MRMLSQSQKQFAPKKNSSVRDVVGVVASFYNIDEVAVYEKTRKKEIVKPRQIVMYLLREDFGVSYPTIGQKMGAGPHNSDAFMREGA